MPYRLLSRSDFVRADDEFLTDDCETWAALPVGTVAGFPIGRRYVPEVYQPARRAIEKEPK